jgi:hypothetical protein
VDKLLNPPLADTQLANMRCKHRAARKDAQALTKAGGFHQLPTTFNTYHHPSRTMPTRTLRASKLVNPCRQNHGQAKDVQAKAAHTKQGKSKHHHKQTGNALPVCLFDPFRDVRQIQGHHLTRCEWGIGGKICNENIKFETMGHDQ